MSRQRVGVVYTCLAAFFFFLFPLASECQAKWKYQRAGNASDSTTTAKSGYALMGGGSQLAEAFQFLCERANGGDFLVLSANDDDSYLTEENARIKAICPLNSAATLSFSSREDSADPQVVEIISYAESIFIAGGDQSNYVRYWQDTPVENALNQHIAAGKPIGGSSAGLAILGEYSFSAMIDTIHSPEVLLDPYANEVTLSREFLKIPLLRSTITDTHFVKRDRLGRLLVFMARILRDGWASEVDAIAVEENAAVVVEADGRAKVVGHGPAYFLKATGMPQACAPKQPLNFGPVSVQRVEPNQTFDLRAWRGQSEGYSVSAVNGAVRATSGAHNPY